MFPPGLLTAAVIRNVPRCHQQMADRGTGWVDRTVSPSARRKSADAAFAGQSVELENQGKFNNPESEGDISSVYSQKQIPNQKKKCWEESHGNRRGKREERKGVKGEEGGIAMGGEGEEN